MKGLIRAVYLTGLASLIATFISTALVIAFSIISLSLGFIAVIAMKSKQAVFAFLFSILVFVLVIVLFYVIFTSYTLLE